MAPPISKSHVVVTIHNATHTPMYAYTKIQAESISVNVQRGPQGYVPGVKDVDIFKPPVVEGPRITLFTLSIFRLCSFLLTVRMLFHCVVTRF